MSKVKIYIVDGSAYIYRAYHAIRSLNNSKGLATNATFGFANIINRILKEKEPTHMVVAWDSKGKTFRHEIYPDYKANRPPMPDDLVEQIPYIKRVISAWNIPSLEEKGLEADDLIASMATSLSKDGSEVIIVSGDKDLLQLVSPFVSQWDPMSDKFMDEDAITKKYGVTPGQLLDYLSLAGDSADNIPGVPGVGPKTAARLIQEYGSLSAIYDGVESMKKSRLKERLINHRQDAFLSRELISLKSDADVPLDLSAYQIGEADAEAVHELFSELEFSSFLQENNGAVKVNTDDFQMIDSKEQLSLLVDKIKKSDVLVMDTETTSLEARKAKLVGVSLSLDDQVYYLPCGHVDEQGQILPGQLAHADIVAALRFVLGSDKLLKVAHNLKYDWTVLASDADIKMTMPLHDTMIGAWLLEPGRRSYKLDDLCRHEGVEMTPFVEVTAGDKKEGAFARVALDAALSYSGEDVYGTRLLWEKQKEELVRLGLWQLFAEVEMPLVVVLAEMEMAGIMLDTNKLKTLAHDFAIRMGELAGRIYSMAGHEFNLNSSQQLAEVLFDELGLPKGRKTKTGYSTDVKVLEKLGKVHELPLLILEYRNLAKLKSTYVDKLLKLAKKEQDNRVHSSFNQCGTATGRLSSSEPNLQNIPIRTREGRQIRSCFVAPQDFVLLSADYSQIDLRVLAHYSQDEALLAAFNSGEDVHRKTASEIFRVSPALVTKEMRRVAKTINFGIVYGMSSFGLASQLQISRKEAQEFIERYFAVYEGVKKFMEDIAIKAAEDGFVTTILGRRRNIPDINSKNRNQREFAKRIAINTPVQGSAADIIKLAMLKVADGLRGGEMQGRMLLQIHDELVLEVREGEVEPVSLFLRKTMENVVELSVPLVVNVKSGYNLDME